MARLAFRFVGEDRPRAGEVDSRLARLLLAIDTEIGDPSSRWSVRE